MLTNDYVILAKDVTTDSNDNMVSILKIVDNLEIGVDPSMYEQMNAGDDKIFNSATQFAIASSFSLDKLAEKDQYYILKVEIIAPRGKTLWEVKQEIVLKKNTDRARINLNLQGMPISGSGKYTFRLSALEKAKVLTEKTTFLNIKISKNTPQTQASTQ